MTQAYLIGQETCASCGTRCLVIMRADATRGQLAAAGNPLECDDCGVEAARVDVWYPAVYWPEVLALVKFDDERQRLKLPPLTEARMQ